MADKAILLVDDEAILLLALKRSLRIKLGSGYRFETAVSAAEGFKAIDELASEGVELALVISDWLMPGMKGDEFLELVRERRPGTSLIMLTGHADKAEMDKLAQEVGLKAFLRKPWDPERLFEAVDQALA